MRAGRQRAGQWWRCGFPGGRGTRGALEGLWASEDGDSLPRAASAGMGVCVERLMS